jgi:hypothetical protein
VVELKQRIWVFVLKKEKTQLSIVSFGIKNILKEKEIKMSNERVRVITEEQYKEYMELKKHISQQEKKVKRWKPKKREKYYAICRSDYIGCYIWTNKSSDILCFKLGNCFKTEEEARKEFDRRLVEWELLSRCDFDGRVELCYDEHAECFEADDTSEFPYYHSPYRFTTKKSCQKAIDTLGTEKLKLIFRID